MRETALSLLLPDSGTACGVLTQKAKSWLAISGFILCSGCSESDVEMTGAPYWGPIDVGIYLYDESGNTRGVVKFDDPEFPIGTAVPEGRRVNWEVRIVDVDSDGDLKFDKQYFFRTKGGELVVSGFDGRDYFPEFTSISDFDSRDEGEVIDMMHIIVTEIPMPEKHSLNVERIGRVDEIRELRLYDGRAVLDVWGEASEKIAL